MKLCLSPPSPHTGDGLLTGRAHQQYAVPRAAREVREGGQLTEV
ncbi:hypothetical protein ACWF0M_31580 [Kribbella sp. NPDC055110]